MPELNESVDAAVAAANKEDNQQNCPFCPDKNLKDCKRANGNKPTTKVESKPDQLACASLTSKGKFDYTTAKHHLISAKQCYARLTRAVRMGSLAKYDINDPPNGIALPTVANNLRFTVGASNGVKYGALSDGEKKVVAFAVMETEGAQWHVGHHQVLIDMPEHWAEELDDAPWIRGHCVSYDSEVINQLLKILSKYKTEKECDDKKPDRFKADMDELSGKIKDKLNQFKTKSPGDSSPYFVSQLAGHYAKSKDTAPPAPPPKPSLDD